MAAVRFPKYLKENYTLLTQESVMIRFSRIARRSIFFFASLTVWGQSFSGKIVGLVTDSSAAVIPSVAVTVVNEGTAAQRRLITDANGIYVAPELPVGYYTVRFDAP